MPVAPTGDGRGGQPEPVMPGAREFQALTVFLEKKQIVQELEVRIVAKRIRLGAEQRQRCAASVWDLDRIVLYLSEEHDTGAARYEIRRLRVEHEEQRLRASGFKASLMPLSYAAGSLLSLLKARPRLADTKRADARLLADLRDDLAEHPASIEEDRSRETWTRFWAVRVDAGT